MLTSGRRRMPMTTAERWHGLLVSAQRGSTRSGDSGGRATAALQATAGATMALQAMRGREEVVHGSRRRRQMGEDRGWHGRCSPAATASGKGRIGVGTTDGSGCRGAAADAEGRQLRGSPR
ncbi:hypothetical protein E2562_037762 [Oryza meyeriana var. granulata]|uniref:Uncharacterized protein n=1 Tax=Oryza meyeriana var. granulata TaxID=110450 RepID=A0A6G1FGL2_9ORYZ|nr:hypothetical protein E2562_037762 [Oryza meyeriana var. granulata]